MSVGVGSAASVHLLEELDFEYRFWRYFELYRRRPYAFLLDSAKDAGGSGAYSFLGSDPFLVFDAKRLRRGPARAARIRITRPSDPGDGSLPPVSTYLGDPFSELQLLLREYELDPSTFAARPVPFLAGAVGYFGYEAGYFLECLPDLGRDDLGRPEIHFGLFDAVLAHDHASGATYLSVVGRGQDEAAAYRQARRLLDRRIREIREFEKTWREPVDGALPGRVDLDSLKVSAHFDRASYARAVEICKEHIYRGDAFEICLTHRLEAPLEREPWELYKALRTLSPAPFACYLTLGDVQVVSSSPERFLRLGADRIAESRPIKGTRPRGATPAEDSALHDDLSSSVKDRAENMMIVDLARNDLGRVCEVGTVHVPELMVVERYSTLFQLTSTVRGQLAAGRDGIDLVRAAFPGGSMTGAPKIEAMKIIDRLEPVKRSIYSGSIGYLDFAGALDLNIVIRTFITRKGRCYFNVGGAVVADSDPVQEYDETMDKAYALKLALASVQAG